MCRNVCVCMLLVCVCVCARAFMYVSHRLFRAQVLAATRSAKTASSRQLVTNMGVRLVAVHDGKGRQHRRLLLRLLLDTQVRTHAHTYTRTHVHTYTRTHA